ncbi:hypothetical protein QTP86_011764 [Hemibagrus guttatus]|nr:hypothetical protein QTP86_011764 [Hemibagrus guttatus]
MLYVSKENRYSGEVLAEPQSSSESLGYQKSVLKEKRKGIRRKTCAKSSGPEKICQKEADPAIVRDKR